MGHYDLDSQTSIRFQEVEPCSSTVDLYVFVSDLLALRTEEEWEEVRQRISDLPQDEALSAEFTKVLPTLLSFVLSDMSVSF